MYPLHDLYSIYSERLILTKFSSVLPDVTKKVTLQNMNYAINVCDKWDHCMDIGGGTGHYLAALAGKFKRATLVELETHPEHSDLKNKFKNISIYNEYIEKYTITEKVDFILLADLYEHIPDIETFVKKISDLQNESGVVYIMTPNPVYCGPAPESGLYHKINDHGHIKQYTTIEIVKLMESVGYKLVLKLYEEAPLRQKVKWFLFAISWRDKKWSGSFLYQLIRPIYLITGIIIFNILEKIVYKSEKNARYNELVTMTQDLIFKKI